jgi:probable HAF family extracellular repeat protein
MKPFCIAVALASIPGIATAQLSYSLTNLTTGSSYDSTAPYGINGAGHVTGYGVVTSSGEIHAFVYSGGSFQDLGLLGYGATVGIGINDSDQLALDGETPGEDALLYSNGKASKIGNVDDGASWCFDINNSGDIVGSARNGDGNTVGYSYVGGVFTDLTTYNPDIVYARSINDSDVLVGSLAYYPSRYAAYLHGYVFDGTTCTDLGSITGNPKTNTEAFGINSAGQIVGYSQGSDNLDHAFLYSGGTMQDLGTIDGGDTSAVAINSGGLIVGNSVGAYGANLGSFVCWNGKMMELSSLIVSGGKGWSELVVTGVNDSGSIVGTGTVNGGTQGFLLTLPVAAWKNYGAGFPGTTGVPGFTAEANPTLGSTLTLDLGNSRGVATTAFVLAGYAQTSIQTGKGGTILVAPSLVLPLSMPAGGTTLVGTLPNDPTLAGFQVDLQAIELDAGAAKGLSFTPGLELDLGY